MSLLEVTSFFDAYRDAFNRFDGQAVADLWHSPSAISHPAAQSGACVTSWASDEPMRQNHLALCQIYAKRSAHEWSFAISDHVALGADQSFANVTWTATTPLGSISERFQTAYLLIRASEGIRVAHCVQYEEKSEKAPSP
jgi:hypothetical protein